MLISVKSVLSQVLFQTSQFHGATGEANCLLTLRVYTNRLMQITTIHSVNIVTDVEVINFSTRANSRYLSTPHMHDAVFNQFLQYTISLSLAQNCMLRMAIPVRVRSVVSSRFLTPERQHFTLLYEQNQLSEATCGGKICPNGIELKKHIAYEDLLN